MSDLKQSNLDEVIKDFKMEFKTENLFGIAADITDDKSVIAMADKVKKDFGGIDILVNAAGARGAAGDFLTLTDDDWMETIQVDLMGAVRLARAFVPQMQGKNWGRIVMIASENAMQPYEEESPYNACKAAIINFSKCLSRIYGKENILVNTVSPAFIETPMTNAMMEELAEERAFLKKKRYNGF